MRLNLVDPWRGKWEIAATAAGNRSRGLVWETKGEILTLHSQTSAAQRLKMVLMPPTVQRFYVQIVQRVQIRVTD